LASFSPSVQKKGVNNFWEGATWILECSRCRNVECIWPPSTRTPHTHTHIQMLSKLTHTHTHTQKYIYIYARNSHAHKLSIFPGEFEIL